MQSLTVISQVLSTVVSLADDVPEAEDVKAGWVAFGIFLALVAATALLCVSFVRQLRKAQAAKDAGVYDEKK